VVLFGEINVAIVKGSQRKPFLQMEKGRKEGNFVAKI